MNAREYTLATASWPRHLWARDDDEVDELGLSIREAGCTADLRIVWRNLGRHDPAVPQLCAFDDAWGALRLLLPVLESLHVGEGGGNASPAEVIQALEGIGFTPSEYHGRLPAITPWWVNNNTTEGIR